MGDVVVVNYLGKLMELGAKCKFVVDSEIVEVPGLSPTFKCIIRIPTYDILDDQVAGNKKAAKAAAAQIVFEKICAKIQEAQTSSLDKIAAKLKDLEVSSDKLTVAVEFYKKLASIDVSQINVSTGNSFTELNDILNPIQCALSYEHGVHKPNDDDQVEYRFICEIRPSGTLSPVIVGCGWSSKSAEEAKDNAVNHLLSVLKTNNKPMN